nr:ATP/GTP-binding protein [Actinoplanes subtropicus]
MVPNRAEQPPEPPESPSETVSCKVTILGGFGVGKTTSIGAISEITPLTTEAVMTNASYGMEDNRHVPAKVTTTVAMDFGRLTLDRDIVVYLFGLPGSTRFWFSWDEIIRGCLGAVVLVDTRRLADSFPFIDYVEQRNLPFAIAVNCFDGRQLHTLEDVREALAITPEVPVVAFDARDRSAVRRVLITLLQHVLRPVPVSGDVTDRGPVRS